MIENPNYKKAFMKDDENAYAFCPYINQPMEDCYCGDLGSQKIEMTVHYCKSNYKGCEIYKRTQGE